MPRGGSRSRPRSSSSAFLAWTVVVAHDRNQRGLVPDGGPRRARRDGLLLAAVALIRARAASGWAFAATGLGAIGCVATIFTGLYPRVLVSHPSFANSLTISSAAAGHYALKVITVVAAIFIPIVLLYQGWTYHVFRARLGGDRRWSPVEPLDRRPPARRRAEAGCAPSTRASSAARGPCARC